MQLVSFFSTLALLSTALAASHGHSSDHSTRFRKFRLPSDNQSSAASVLERRASGSHIRYSYYYPEESGNPTACGEMQTSEDPIVAVPIEQFQSSWCNRGISIKYKGKTVNARINDACVGCPWDSLDLTPSLFRALDGGLGAGYLWGGSWNFHGSGDDGDDEPKPTTTTKKPEPSTTKTRDPPTTSSSSSSSKRRTSTTSSWEESTTSSSRSSSRFSSASSSSTSASSSSSQQPSATPTPTRLPGSIGSLESALGGFAQFLLAGAQQG